MGAATKTTGTYGHSVGSSVDGFWSWTPGRGVNDGADSFWSWTPGR